MLPMIFNHNAPGSLSTSHPKRKHANSVLRNHIPPMASLRTKSKGQLPVVTHVANKLRLTYATVGKSSCNAFFLMKGTKDIVRE